MKQNKDKKYIVDGSEDNHENEISANISRAKKAQEEEKNASDFDNYSLLDE